MRFLDPFRGKPEYIHSWYLFIMTFFGLFFLLVSSVLILNLILASFLLFFYFKNGLKGRTFFRIALFTFFFSGVFLLLNLLYPGEKNKTGELLYISNFSFYEGALITGLKTFLRLFLLMTVSMCSTLAITYTKVILYLIIHKGLKVFMGYPLLIALNSILLFKEEFDRIRLSAKFRGLGWWDRLFVLFPLLVFAIRHSQRGSLSLVTRGLNPNKSFYFGYEIVSRDKLYLRTYLLGLFVMFVILVYIVFYFR